MKRGMLSLLLGFGLVLATTGCSHHGHGHKHKEWKGEGCPCSACKECHHSEDWGESCKSACTKCSAKKGEAKTCSGGESCGCSSCDK